MQYNDSLLGWCYITTTETVTRILAHVFQQGESYQKHQSVSAHVQKTQEGTAHAQKTEEGTAHAQKSQEGIAHAQKTQDESAQAQKKQDDSAQSEKASDESAQVQMPQGVFWIDDVWLTGYVAGSLNIPRLSLNSYFTVYR